MQLSLGCHRPGISLRDMESYLIVILGAPRLVRTISWILHPSGAYCQISLPYDTARSQSVERRCARLILRFVSIRQAW